MREFTIAATIASSAERVWAVMADVERWPEWTASITRVDRVDQGTFGVGSKAWVRQPRLPPGRWIVTVWEPGRRFVWESRGPGLAVIASHAIESKPGGCEVVLSVRFEGLLGGLLARLTAEQTRRYMELEAAGLKKRSESPTA